MKQEFYFLRDKYGSGYAKAIYKTKDVTIKVCKICGGRHVVLNSNLQVEFKGKKKADYYAVPGFFIISPKMYNILKENNVSGFEVKDITILESLLEKDKKSSFKNDNLKQLIITSESGYLRKMNGTLFEKCNACNRVIEDMEDIKGIKINIDEWDGSDIFFIKNFKGIPVVTKRVKDILESNKIKNVQFTNVNDIELC